jgi:hypothetical protein
MMLVQNIQKIRWRSSKQQQQREEWKGRNVKKLISGNQINYALMRPFPLENLFLPASFLVFCCSRKT